MHSSLIGKIEKARRYAQQPERVRFTSFELTFQGEHDEYRVSLRDDQWHCSCHFFEGYGTCAHIMGVQRMFETNLSAAAQTGAAVAQAV